jgi:hypothetical protein
MKTFNRIKSYQKINKDTRKSIDKGIQKLRDRLNTYFSNNENINDIHGDGILIHDIYDEDGYKFYVYKCRVLTMSLRLLYTIEDGNLVIVSYYIKETPYNKINDYFKFFELECKIYCMNKKR